jgi:gas vesicle protein
MNTRDLLTGAGVGAALAFMLDPDRGRRRRALVTDQMTRASRTTRRALDATARDLGNRARGLAAGSRARPSDRDLNDQKLVERVRSKLGRVSSHPRAIEVSACEGEVKLCGPILAHEVDDLVALAGTVPGVRRVINDLEPHASADNVPALQGDGRVAEPSWDILQRHWSPATRALVGAGGLAAGAWVAAQARRTWHTDGETHPGGMTS